MGMTVKNGDDRRKENAPDLLRSEARLIQYFEGETDYFLSPCGCFSLTSAS